MKMIPMMLFVSRFSWNSNAQILTSSTLPIVMINTGAPVFNDNTIPDDPKLGTSFVIIYNGPGVLNNITDPINHFNGFCGI
jgi:hypothetical protein